MPVDWKSKVFLKRKPYQKKIRKMFPINNKKHINFEKPLEDFVLLNLFIWNKYVNKGAITIPISIPKFVIFLKSVLFFD